MDSCKCGVLDHASKEPDHVVRWDDKDKTFYLAYGQHGRLMIYYCPFLRRQSSRRATKIAFAHISDAEMNRLRTIIDGLKTVDDVIAHFGPPDERKEVGSTVTKPEKDAKPAITNNYATIHCRKLSEVADMFFDIGANNQVRAGWTPKRLAPRDS